MHTKTVALTCWQLHLGLKVHALKNECETRWGSTYDAIERFLEMEPAIRKVLTEDYSSTHLLPSQDALDTLKSMVDALNPLCTFTDLLSGNTKYIASHPLEFSH